MRGRTGRFRKPGKNKKEVEVLLTWWKDNVQPLTSSTLVPRKFRR